MYDFRLIYAFPQDSDWYGAATDPGEGRRNLEDSIAKTLSDGWEYQHTSVAEHRVSAEITAPGFAFVYRREANRQMRTVSAVPDGRDAVKAVEENVIENVVFRHTPPAVPARDRSLTYGREKLLRIALMNALAAHRNIDASDLQSSLIPTGDRADIPGPGDADGGLSARPPRAIADLIPEWLADEAFQVSLLPFADCDQEYIRYMTELADCLGLDGAFVSTAFDRVKVA